MNPPTFDCTASSSGGFSSLKKIVKYHTMQGQKITLINPVGSHLIRLREQGYTIAPRFTAWNWFMTIFKANRRVWEVWK
jgi:hypothetical protein